jgi:hypothetical protein
LFDQDQFSADQFNQLVEGGMRVITDLLEANMSKEQLEEYLQVKVSGRDETRKVILQFWKQEGAQLLQAVRTPTLNVA